jgi:hypothetical protein
VRTGPSGDLRPGRPRRRRWLRTAQLNAVGYAALVAVCLLAGVVTAVGLLWTRWPLTIRILLGPVVVVLALVSADHRKWSRMETSFSFTGDAELTRVAADRLAAAELPVAVTAEDGQLNLRYPNRYAGRVHAVLESLGIR